MTHDAHDAGTGTPVEPGPPRGSSHEPPPGAGFMNAFRWVLFAGLLALALASVAGYVAWRRQANRPVAGAGTARYHCPMHPTFTSDRKGTCPICSMDLEPIPSEGAPIDSAGSGDVPGLTPVYLSPERVQMIGVRLAIVEHRPLSAAVELVGFVAPDESRLRRVQLRVSGWVEELHVSNTGQEVTAGQPLLSIYSPELYQSEREFLIELGAASPDSGPSHLANALPAARERLRLLGIPEQEIRRLERERTAGTRLALGAPVSGTVLEKGVVEGQYVGAETPLFTVADLSRVWVLADLYEQDLPRVHRGDAASFTADALPGTSIGGTVDFIYPTVSSDTRTVKARIVLDNANGRLRPGMYGRVRLSGRGAAMVVVPSEALVRTGENTYVFLARSDGHFEPRAVRTGAQSGDRVQVLSGLAPGDTVVSSASFLIDSESRLKAAIAGMGSKPGAHEHGSPR